MADVQMTDHTAEVLSALEQAKARALEIIGGKAESYAKGIVPKVTGTLQNSITHQVDGDTVIVGSAVHYAPYVELGTGKAYSPPPEWMENNAERGHGLGNYNRNPKPYLRPAVENHIDEYKNVMENELKKG